MIESNVKVFEADVNGINYQQMGIGAIEVIKLYFRRLTFDNLCQQAKSLETFQKGYYYWCCIYLFFVASHEPFLK